MLKKLIKIFNANSTQHLIVIFIVFGLTGSFSVYISNPILELLQLDEVIQSPPLYWFARLSVVMIAYQLSLLLIATPFGQFTYFLKIQKRFLNRFRLNNKK
tara:strand:- start:201 stop:503 length:303 start_codon:yes stop_codon:yes gene_type:complete